MGNQIDNTYSEGVSLVSTRYLYRVIWNTRKFFWTYDFIFNIFIIIATANYLKITSNHFIKSVTILEHLNVKIYLLIFFSILHSNDN